VRTIFFFFFFFLFEMCFFLLLFLMETPIFMKIRSDLHSKSAYNKSNSNNETVKQQYHY